ncbi:MAG: hypothetical protein EOO00_13840 [Chitinophagaceae bacterium]|nr:MAG: hypothetical protein EOO00_13840 [Chitinophagaceae bacterium]
MDRLHKTNVATDQEYRTRFKGFYRVRRNEEFCNLYFGLLERNKTNKSFSFMDVLSELCPLGKLEASFSSKLIATINPEMPVWDTEVLKHMNGELEIDVHSEDRIQAAGAKYAAMINWYQMKVHSSEGKTIVAEFDRRFPASGISDVKKIDLVLWQTR